MSIVMSSDEADRPVDVSLLPPDVNQVPGPSEVDEEAELLAGLDEYYQLEDNAWRETCRRFTDQEQEIDTSVKSLGFRILTSDEQIEESSNFQSAIDSLILYDDEDELIQCNDLNVKQSTSPHKFLLEEVRRLTIELSYDLEQVLGPIDESFITGILSEERESLIEQVTSELRDELKQEENERRLQEQKKAAEKIQKSAEVKKKMKKKDDDIEVVLRKVERTTPPPVVVLSSSDDEDVKVIEEPTHVTRRGSMSSQTSSASQISTSRFKSIREEHHKSNNMSKRNSLTPSTSSSTSCSSSTASSSSQSSVTSENLKLRNEALEQLVKKRNRLVQKADNAVKKSNKMAGNLNGVRERLELMILNEKEKKRENRSDFKKVKTREEMKICVKERLKRVMKNQPTSEYDIQNDKHFFDVVTRTDKFLEENAN